MTRVKLFADTVVRRLPAVKSARRAKRRSETGKVLPKPRLVKPAPVVSMRRQA